MAKVIAMACPHCGKRGAIRSSIEKNKTMRDVYFYCTNMLCGHSWVATLEAVRTISPPSKACRDPSIDLPELNKEDIYLLNDQFEAEVSNQRSIFEIFQNLEDKK